MLKDDTEQLSASLNQKAMVSLESNNFNIALSLLHQANYLLKNKKITDSIVQLKCTTLNNLGCVYKRLEKPKKALFYLKEALSLAHRFSSTIDTSSIHLNISAIKSMQSLHEEALFHALTSLKLCNNNFSSGKVTALLSSYYQVGCEYQFLHRVQEAKKYFSQGFELAHKHLGKSHLITLKFFKAVHDKSLREYDVYKFKRTVLKPIPEKVRRNESNFNEKKDVVRRRDKVQSYTPSPVQKNGLKSKTVSSSSILPDKVQNHITYIGNTLDTMQKRIEFYSNKIPKLDPRRSATPSSISSKNRKGPNRAKAGLIIQKTLRMWKDRKKYLDILKKVKKIQKKFREWRCLNYFLKSNKKVLHFSQQFNKDILNKHWETHKVAKENADIQTEFEIFLVFQQKIAPSHAPLNFFKTLIRLQRSVKRYLNKKRRMRAALMIQKFFRMYQVRKMYWDQLKFETRFQRSARKAMTMKEVSFNKISDVTIKSKKRWTRVLEIN